MTADPTPARTRLGRFLEVESLEDRRVLSTSPLAVLSALPALPEVAALKVAVHARVDVVNIHTDLAATANVGTSALTDAIHGNGKALGHVLAVKADLTVGPDNPGGGGGVHVEANINVGPGNVGGSVPGNGGGSLPGGGTLPVLPGGIPGSTGLPGSSTITLSGQAGGGNSLLAFLGPDQGRDPSGLSRNGFLNSAAGESDPLAAGLDSANPGPLGSGINATKTLNDALSSVGGTGMTTALDVVFIRAAAGLADPPSVQVNAEVAGADLLTDFVVASGPGAEGLLEQLLARLNVLAEEAGNSLLSRELAVWLLAGALAAAAYAHTRRRHPQGAGAHHSAGNSSWKWLSGSAGFTPEAGA